MKYTKEFKLECIRKHKTGEYIEAPSGFNKRKYYIEQVRKREIMFKSLGRSGFEYGRPALDK